MLLPYYIYTRVVNVYLAYFFYTRQKYGVKTFEVSLPIIGDALLTEAAMKQLVKKKDDPRMPLIHMIDEYFGGSSFVGTILFFGAHNPALVLCDPKVLEDLYTTKNIYFSKHPIVRELTKFLTGNSILFDETSENLKQRRKAMSPAFYKGKLQEMVKLATGVVQKFCKELDVRVSKDTIRVDIVEEIARFSNKVLLTCVLGEDIGDTMMDYWIEGKLVKKDVSFALRDTFGKMIERY